MGEIIGKLTIDAGKKLLQTVLDELIRRGAIWLADRIEKLFSAATERFGRKAQLPKEISEQITRIDRDVRKKHSYFSQPIFI